jgi:hypothetical protein
MSRLLRTDPSGDIREEMVVGRAFEVGNRTVYPVIQVMTFEGKGRNFFGGRISPLAMVVFEPTREYVVALRDEPFSSEQLLEMVAFSKREAGKRPRGMGSKNAKK